MATAISTGLLQSPISTMQPVIQQGPLQTNGGLLGPNLPGASQSPMQVETEMLQSLVSLMQQFQNGGSNGNQGNANGALGGALGGMLGSVDGSSGVDKLLALDGFESGENNFGPMHQQPLSGALGDNPFYQLGERSGSSYEIQQDPWITSLQ